MCHTKDDRLCECKKLFLDVILDSGRRHELKNKFICESLNLGEFR